jgi:hypothetical protein
VKKNRPYNGQKCEDTKVVIRRCKVKKNRPYNGQKIKGHEGQTIIYKTLHIKLKIEQCDSHSNPEMTTGAPG